MLVCRARLHDPFVMLTPNHPQRLEWQPPGLDPTPGAPQEIPPPEPEQPSPGPQELPEEPSEMPEPAPRESAGTRVLSAHSQRLSEQIT